MSSTVVTCFYNLKSKHTFETYDKWIQNLLPNIQCNLVVFTSPDLKDYILNYRKTLLDKTVIICQEFNELELTNKYGDYWDRQYELDPQKHFGRNQNCYILWNSKLWFMKQAISINPFVSDKFVWTDIGCLRNTNLNQIDQIKLYPLYDNISMGKIDIVLMNTIPNIEQTYFFNEVHFAGAMFGSDTNTIIKLYDRFYQKLDQFIKEDKFIGCDQQTISSVYNENRELFNTIDGLTYSWDERWFYLWKYYTTYEDNKINPIKVHIIF
jgi:hypothetical protein